VIKSVPTLDIPFVTVTRVNCCGDVAGVDEVPVRECKRIDGANADKDRARSNARPRAAPMLKDPPAMFSSPTVLWSDDVAPAPMAAPCTVAIGVNMLFPFVPHPDPISAFVPDLDISVGDRNLRDTGLAAKTQWPNRNRMRSPGIARWPSQRDHGVQRRQSGI
jgi:hypothetical protein